MVSEPGRPIKNVCDQLQRPESKSVDSGYRRLLAKTQFRDGQGLAIRDSLLRSGDQLSVLVNPDDPKTAVGVVLVRKRS